MPIGSSCTAKVSQIYQSTKKIALFFKTTTRKNLADGLERTGLAGETGETGQTGGTGEAGGTERQSS